MRSCDNCHNAYCEDLSKICFEKLPFPSEDEENCFDSESHPRWTPMTNGDKLRSGTDEDLVEAWARLEYPEELRANCDTCPIGCKNFTEECCPATFLKWLKAPAVEVEG